MEIKQVSLSLHKKSHCFIFPIWLKDTQFKGFEECKTYCSMCKQKVLVYNLQMTRERLYKLPERWYENMLNTMSCVYCHFSTIFHCIMAVCFIDGGNETIRREPLTFLIGGKLYYIILYQVHLDRVRSLSGTCACNRHRFLENPEKINQWQVADIIYFIKLYWVLFAISGISWVQA